MNNVILAAFLGGWEILFILMALFLVSASAPGAVIFLIVYLLRFPDEKVKVDFPIPSGH